MRPAYAMLREVDTHKPTMHTVYESALEVQEAYKSCDSTVLSPAVVKLLQEQWTKDWEYLHVPIHSAAYTLHPKYKDDAMQENGDVWPDFLQVAFKLLGAVDGSLAVEQFNLYQQGDMTDGQIINNEFLVYLNAMLASGWISDLFPKEDIDNLFNALRGEAKQAFVPDNPEAMFDFLVRDALLW